ncbi:hypothetical protein PilKf_02386 [Pillotina sp. SPG140]|jgi:hypothetical protein
MKASLHGGAFFLCIKDRPLTETDLLRGINPLPERNNFLLSLLK